MTRGAKGCLIAAAAMLFILVVVAAGIMLAGGVRRDTVLDLTIAGEIVEDYEDTFQTRLFRGKVTMLSDITVALDRASRDDHVKGLVARVKPFEMGLGKIQEVRDAVIAFRAAGKPAHVYIDSAGEFSSANGFYYLVTAFDEIWMSPAGDLNLHGLLSVTPFFRGLLDKLGVYPDLDSIGEYKNAKDIYTNKDMTAAHREATLSYMNDWHGQIAGGISDERGIPREEVEAILDGGPYLASEALDRKLVDHIAYHDEFAEAMEDVFEEDSRMDAGDYLAKAGRGSGPRIAVITGMGIIVTGRSMVDPWGGAVMGSETIGEAFRSAREDSGIEAVIFRVDSPGGSPLASDLIWREVALTAEEKPVIVSHSDYAASGGYYVSLAGTRVVSQPGTLTGSIGVVAGKMVTEGFYDWIGLHREAIKMGDNATYYYAGSRYTDAEREVYWKFMRRTYEMFSTRVAEARGMSVEEVDAIGRGHVWTGERALELGLVDEMGGLTRAIAIAREEAGIPEDTEVRLVTLPEKPTFWESLLWPDESTGLLAALPPEMTGVARELSRLMMLSREGVWMLARVPDRAP